MTYKFKTLAIAAITTTISLFSANTAQAAYQEPYCREYSETFQIGGRTQQGYGTACLQPDGSWQKQDSTINESFESQKQNVVYVIDRQPVEIYRPYYRPAPVYSTYGYAQPSTFFSVSLGNDYGYRSRPNYYYHNRGYYNNHRGHDNGWNDNRGHGRGNDDHGGRWNR